MRIRLRGKGTQIRERLHRMIVGANIIELFYMMLIVLMCMVLGLYLAAICMFIMLGINARYHIKQLINEEK